MLAQALGSTLHVPILLALVKHFPDDLIMALGVATSISSFVKLVAVLLTGLLSKDIRASWVSPLETWRSGLQSTGYMGQCKGDFCQIQLPSMIMFCAEGWAFQILTLISGFISV